MKSPVKSLSAPAEVGSATRTIAIEAATAHRLSVFKVYSANLNFVPARTLAKPDGVLIASSVGNNMRKTEDFQPTESLPREFKSSHSSTLS